MSDEEIFYDSLEEDNFETEDHPSSIPPTKSKEEIIPKNEDSQSTISTDKDLADVVPLYNGEIPKNKVPKPKNRTFRKTSKLVIPSNNRKNKSYLTMYYEKKKQLEVKPTLNGSMTSRAECGKLSPERDSQLDEDLKGIESRYNSGTDSDQEEFYENFIASVENQKSASITSLVEVKKSQSSKFSSRSSTNLKATEDRPFYMNYCVGDAMDKLELLKKRQTYGTKMSMKNRIRIEELKSLKKIKDSSTSLK